MTLFRWFALGLAVSLPGKLLAAEPQPPIPLGNPGDWISTEDYPAAALRDEIEGVVRFEILVDKFGKPAACTIKTSSGSAQLDATACNLIMVRSRFEPAKDKRGNATNGVYSNSVRWNIPRIVDHVKPGVLIRSFLVGVDGTLSDCKIEKVEGGAAETSKVGPIPCGRQFFSEGYRDPNGQFVRKRIRETSTIELVDP